MHVAPNCRLLRGWLACAGGQSALLSGVCLACELALMYTLKSAAVPILTTAFISVLVVQGFLALGFLLFGALWHRTLGRVRATVRLRVAAVASINAVLASLPQRAVARVVTAVTALQGGVRQRQAMVKRLRLQAMEAFEGTAAERHRALLLVQVLVVVYLAVCLYLMLLYGTLVETCGRHRVER